MVDFSDIEVERLAIFEDLLRLHNGRYNLVGSSALGDLWERHILDSAQLARFFSGGEVILDIGSGAGFPGFILSILGYDLVLLDRNRHKCDFLRIASRACGVGPEVLRMDVCDYVRGGWDGRFFDFVVVRAVSGLVDLLPMCLPFLEVGSVCLLMKGRGYEGELDLVDDVLRERLNIDVFVSETGCDGVILRVSI